MLHELGRHKQRALNERRKQDPMKTKMLQTTLSAVAAFALTAGAGAVPSAAASSSGERPHACAGIRADAAFLSSDEHHIEDIKPLRRVHRIGKVPMQRTVGVQVLVRPHEGLSKQYLQRMVNCQIPRELSAVAQSDDVPAVNANIREHLDTLIVDIEAENVRDGKTVEELVNRAYDQRGQRGQREQGLGDELRDDRF